MPLLRPLALAALLAAGVLFPLHPTLAQSACPPPVATDDHWPIATPEQVGLSSATLCPLAQKLEAWKESNVHAVVVIRHGKLVFEHYFAGKDENWGRSLGTVQFGPATLHDERSATKSVVSLLLGIAIQRGWVKSIDAPVYSLLPQYDALRTPEKDRITLRHFVTMSAGLEWHELDRPYTSNSNSENEMDYAADPYRYVLAQPVVVPPGHLWNYNSGLTEVVGLVLKQTTGKPVDELARTLLFAPLGITQFEWGKYSEGNPIAAGALRMRPRDLAKIGQLVLNHGEWNGTQVVPKKWIDDAIRPQIQGISIYYYGDFFWLGRSFVHGHSVEWAAAWGLGGQRAFIVPALDLVVVVNAGLYTSDLQTAVPLIILNQFVLAALQDRS